MHGGNRGLRWGAGSQIPRDVGSRRRRCGLGFSSGVRSADLAWPRGGAGPRFAGGPAGLGRGRRIPRFRRRFPGSFKFESLGGGAAASGTGVVERRGRAAAAAPWRRGRRGR